MHDLLFVSFRVFLLRATALFIVAFGCLDSARSSERWIFLDDSSISTYMVRVIVKATLNNGTTVRNEAWGFIAWNQQRLITTTSVFNNIDSVKDIVLTIIVRSDALLDTDIPATITSRDDILGLVRLDLAFPEGKIGVNGTNKGGDKRPVAHSRGATVSGPDSRLAHVLAGLTPLCRGQSQSIVDTKIFTFGESKMSTHLLLLRSGHVTAVDPRSIAVTDIQSKSDSAEDLKDESSVNEVGSPIFSENGDVVGIGVRPSSADKSSETSLRLSFIPINKAIELFNLGDSGQNCKRVDIPVIPETLVGRQCRVKKNCPKCYDDRRITCGGPEVAVEEQNDDRDPGEEKSDVRPLDPTCNIHALQGTVVRDERWRNAFHEKDAIGFLNPPLLDPGTSQLSISRKKVLGLQLALRSLSQIHYTVLLVYGQVTTGVYAGGLCAWLIDSRGVIASAFTTKVDDNLHIDLLNGMQVSISSAGTRSAQDECTFPKNESYNLDMANESLRRASEIILPPAIASALAMVAETDPRLLIAPIGIVGEFPIAALRIPGGQIVDKFAVVVIPNIASLEKFEPGPNYIAKLEGPIESNSFSSNDGDKALVVGNPDLTWDKNYCWAKLKYAESESAAAGLVGNSVPILGPEANYHRVMEELRRRQDTLRFIYFATHGLVDLSNPSDGSLLALSEAHLHGSDIKALRLAKGPLVVMSACDTGIGKTFAGGVYGLAWQWYSAGASQIAMSLWDIDDEGTSDLMRTFLSKLSGPLEDTEFALRAAMLQARERVKKPSVWSAMTLYGDPSR